MAVVIDKRTPMTDFGSVTVLVRPRCGSESIHHQAATLYDRPEDAEMVVRSTVENGSAKIDVVASESSGNPSSRRDGLSIKFWCEGCKGIDEDVLELTVSQHKGSTELGWRYSPKAPREG
jgi:hypothetical protein